MAYTEASFQKREVPKKISAMSERMLEEVFDLFFDLKTAHDASHTRDVVQAVLQLLGTWPQDWKHEDHHPVFERECWTIIALALRGRNQKEYDKRAKEFERITGSADVDIL